MDVAGTLHFYPKLILKQTTEKMDSYGYAEQQQDQYGAENAMDDKQYQDHFRKTFITDNQKKEAEEESWTLHDMMIPGGQPAKLVRVHNPMSQDFRVSEVCDRLKFIQPTPVIVLAGAKTERPGKTMAGITRAAFNTGAYVVDSGLGTQIERFCQRKGVMLIGVCPEAEIDYPRLNPANRKDTELTNGHTHFFTVGKEKGSSKGVQLKWGQESGLKFDLARRIAHGRRGGYGNASAPPCKMITVVMGDNEP